VELTRSLLTDLSTKRHETLWQVATCNQPGRPKTIARWPKNLIHYLEPAGDTTLFFPQHVEAFPANRYPSPEQYLFVAHISDPRPSCWETACFGIRSVSLSCKVQLTVNIGLLSANRGSIYTLRPCAPPPPTPIEPGRRLCSTVPEKCCAFGGRRGAPPRRTRCP
jgi:hypothetical protein